MHLKALVQTLLSAFVIAVVFNVLLTQKISAAHTILFPVIGSTSFSNDYNAPRSNGPHHAIDIIANKRQKLVAVADGTITYVAYPEPSWGYMVTIRESNGYRYNYLHINNDNPGTDDGKGGGMNAYATDIKSGNRVVKGQLIGWVGDSGNAENTVSHLHFEMITPDGTVMNPYQSLLEAKHATNYVIPPPLPNEILPYGPTKIGINIAMGNLDLDGQSEIVTGAGKGASSQVRTYDSNRSPMSYNFHVYEGGTFRGGVDVAAADIDGDGLAEIITGAGPGGNPNVRVFKLVAGVPNMIADFNVYSSFKGGIDVAASDVAGDGLAEIITGAGPGGNPNVRVFNSDESLHSSFNAYSSTFRGGVRVSAANVRTSSSKSEILTVPASSGRPIIQMYTHNGGLIDDKMFMEEWWGGYHDIAAGVDTSFAATGINRRASVRFGIE